MKLASCLTVLLGFVVALPAQVHAQSNAKRSDEDVVDGYEVRGFDANGVQIGSYPCISESDRDKKIAEWKATKIYGRPYYDKVDSVPAKVTRPKSGSGSDRPKAPTDPLSRGKVTLPPLGIVDPGGSANSSAKKSPKSWLTGKRGRDKEPGDFESTIEISQTGKVTIASKLGNNYTAELKETPNGTPFFESSSSIFDVTIKGAEITVTRRSKKGFESINEIAGAKSAETWTFTLDGAPFESPMEKGQAYNDPTSTTADLPGIWDREGESGIHLFIRFEPGGQFYMLNTSSAGSLSKGTWSGSASGFRASTTAVRNIDKWDTSYGIVYEVEGRVSNGKLIGRYKTKYLYNDDGTSPWIDFVYLKGDKAAIHDRWWKGRPLN